MTPQAVVRLRRFYAICVDHCEYKKLAIRETIVAEASVKAQSMNVDPGPSVKPPTATPTDDRTGDPPPQEQTTRECIDGRRE